MKYPVTKAICVVALLVPMVATFAPVFSGRRLQQAAMPLGAASDEVPELVKAYSKASAAGVEPNLPQVAPTLPQVAPVVPDPVVVTPASSTPLEVNMPNFDLKAVKLPSIDLPSIDLPAIDIPSIDLPTPTPGTPYTGSPITMDSVKASMAQNADAINSQFSGMNQFFKNAQLASESARSSGAFSKNPFSRSVADLIQEGLTKDQGVQLASSKAPTLAEFMAAGGASLDGLDGSALVDAKTKIALLAHNTAELFGQTDFSLQDLPPDTTKYAAVGIVSLFLAAAANNNNDSSTTTATAATTSSMKVDKVIKEVDSVPVSDLAKDVVSIYITCSELSMSQWNLSSHFLDDSKKWPNKSSS